MFGVGTGTGWFVSMAFQGASKMHLLVVKDANNIVVDRRGDG